MRDYRIELMAFESEIVVYVKSENEYEALAQAKKDYPKFTIIQAVEVMPAVGAGDA